MDTSDSRNKLIVALDVDALGRASRLVDALAPYAGWFKVGSVLFTREGPASCRRVKDAGARLFLDLKFHDIPNTVAGAVDSALDLGADMITLHASGGEAMLRAAVEAREKAGRRDVLLVAVTVLTHLSLADFRTVFASGCSPEENVLALAGVARNAGLDGVVASARELELLKQRFGADFRVVTPGIRPAGAPAGDQRRVVTPRDAVAHGADYLVVGRPVIAAPDPAEACRGILEEMAG